MVKVIDSIMGSGKSSWAINYMKRLEDDNSIMYVTPYLKELDRIEQQTKPEKHFHAPKSIDGSKLNHVVALLQDGKDIAVSHELFKRLNNECKDAIKDNGYVLFLDEVIVPIHQYRFSRKDDDKFLLDSNAIIVNADGLVEWTGDKSYDIIYNEVKQIAENHSLFRIDKNFYIWQFPVEIFSLFEEVYIMTYLFEGSLMKYYFDLYHIKYEKYSVIQDQDGKYQLSDFHEPDKRKYKQLINLYSNADINNNFSQKQTNLSTSWFKRKSNDSSIKQIKNNLTNYARHKCKAKSDDIMWTTFKSEKHKLKGSGYTNGYISINCRATNDYSNRHTLMYVANYYPNPEILKFFSARNITIDKDKYALAEMLQWIWRSAIRNDEPINLFIQSNRMRRLLEKWLQ